MTEAVIIRYLLRKSMDWFLYDNGLRHERVKHVNFSHEIRSLLSIKYSSNFSNILNRVDMKV